MKIVQIIPNLGAGGAERFVVDLSNELSKSNDVYVITFRNRETDFYRSQLSADIHQICYSGGISIISKVWQLFIVSYYLIRLRPDIIHAHLIAFTYIVFPSFLLRKAKCFYTVHNVADKDTNHGFPAKIRAYFLKKRVKGITISDYCAQTFREFYGYDSFMMIENGCRTLRLSNSLSEVKNEIRSLKHSENSKVFVCVARITESKNHILMIRAFKALAKKNIDFELLLIGKCDVNPQIIKILDEAIDCDRIHYLGLRENIPDYLSECDYFCLSSLWEGLPISILEAGLSGCYPICTPVGGVPDVIISEEWGMLSRDVTEDSYREAIEKAMLLKVNAHKIKELYNSRYSIRKCAESYMKAYETELYPWLFH